MPDNVTITLSFSDGSLATIHYFANGGKSLSKKKISVHFDGRSAIIENFKSLFYNSEYQMFDYLNKIKDKNYV